MLNCLCAMYVWYACDDMCGVCVGVYVYYVHGIILLCVFICTYAHACACECICMYACIVHVCAHVYVCVWWMCMVHVTTQVHRQAKDKAEHVLFLDVSLYFISWGHVSLNWRLPSLSRRLARKLSGRSLSDCLQHPRLGLWEATPSFSQKYQGFRLRFSRLKSKHVFPLNQLRTPTCWVFSSHRKPLLICRFPHITTVCDTGVSTIQYCTVAAVHDISTPSMQL